MFLFFFFSSRRRHTRWTGDWSSDVCSSDLCQVAGDDDRPPSGLDHDDLRTARMTWRRDESDPGEQLELAVDRHVPDTARVDPLANRVVVLAARVVELLTLDVDRPAREEVVATAVVEVQVCVDDNVDAGDVEVLLTQGVQARIHVGHQRVQLRHACVDEHASIGMVDDVHVDRHQLALGEQVGDVDGPDGDGATHRFPNPGRAAACSIHDAIWPSSRSSSDSRSTARECLPIPIGVTGGTGVSDVPRPNVSLTWPWKPPHEKHQPSPTPYHAMPHFTERCRPGSVLAASSSTRSAMARCGCGKLLM